MIIRLRHWLVRFLGGVPLDAVRPQDIEWVVSDHAELGVKVHGRTFFLRSGRSHEYTTTYIAKRYRRVGKKEFGEWCRPVHMIRNNRVEIPYESSILIDPLIDPTTKQSDFDWRPIQPR